MNKPIRVIAVFSLVLFALLMANVTYLQFFAAEGLSEDPRNRRVIVESYSRERGAILVNNQAVAKSVPTDDQYKFQRTYDQPLKYAPLTGYFSYYSQTGLEQSENPVLSGDDDRFFVTRLIDLLANNAPAGGSIELTINPAAQQAAYDGLSALPAVEGAVVAIEPKTGKILAMVTLPTYDPNKLSSHDFSEVSKNYDTLNKDDREPLLNRAVQTTLPPGSTFKLVTAAAALESGDYPSVESLVPGGSSYTLPGTSVSIDNEGRNCGTDRITITQALQQSCNTTFLALADQLGLDAMRNQAEAFGFNSEYLDDLPSQAVSRFPSKLDAAQTAQTGMGQSEVTATPLQMAMVTAGIANGGEVMKPYVVNEVIGPDRDLIERTEPTRLSQAVSGHTADELTKAMVATVDSGTATVAQIPGMDVAGKTGTAQSAPDRPPYAWFVSFAPADDPQVAVAVMIQSVDVPRESIAGGALGGPIAKAVMEAVIPQ